LAVNQKYDESVQQLEQAVKEVESVVGQNTNFHLFLYQRLASIHMLQLDFNSVEKRFQQCIEVAEKGKKSMNKKNDQTHNTFIWQNNLIKFYLAHNVDKAIEFSSDILEEQGSILDKSNLSDLKFNLATAYNLRGQDSDLVHVLRLYNECLASCPPENTPFIHNNLGIANFFNFATMSKQINDPKGAGLDALKPIIESFENAILNLKKSVVAFEQFELTFGELDPKKQAAEVPQEVSLATVN
jgi:tetratricopeptide (TPR) repeat protein